MADERDPDFQEKVRAACNAKDAPEQGCMFPWCVCNRYPEPENVQAPMHSSKGT